MNADGSGVTRLTTNPSYSDFAEGWTPDGDRIVVSEYGGCNPACYIFVYTIARDGTDKRYFDPPPNNEESPAWSPDGRLVAYVRYSQFAERRDLYTATPDGQNVQFFCCELELDGREAYSPDWAPDQSAIVFAYPPVPGPTRISRQNVDGTGLTVLPPIGADPKWSPNGDRIIFTADPAMPSNQDVFSINTDGGDQANLTSHPARDWQPDWQPIPINAYPRPKGATPVHASLVPAYAACASPNRQHGPPLAFASCNPPAQTSDELTVGSADSNGKPTRSVSQLRFKTLPGTPPNPPENADVKLEAGITDVYNQGLLTDYTGELWAEISLRITDKLNTPHPGGPGAGTVSDFSFGFTIPCAVTPDPNEGASCTLNTTADALYPGAIAEGRRAIWQLGAVEVHDGGADDDGDTAADNTLFMKQGVFIP